MENNLILEEIRRVHDDRRTGVLSLKGLRGARVEIFFREGVIEAASSNLEGRRIGDYLLKDGSLDAGDVEVIQSAKRRKVCFGETAVRKKLLHPSDLAAAARSQAVDLVEHVLKNGFAVDSFTGSLRAQYAPAGLSFPDMQLELCRNNPAPVEMSDTRFVLANGVDLSVFPWYPQELSILNELRYPGTADELSKRTGVSETNVRKMLGVFHRLSVVDVVSASDSVSSTALLAPAAEFALDTLIPAVTNAVLHEKVEIARTESSFTSEQFKNLKVRIRQAELDRPVKVITISSPDPQDGKSLVSTSLAFSFALDYPGRRVVVVDCDLRNPALHKYLGVPAQPGLIQHLGNGHISPYCYVRRLENLYFLTTGGMAPNPIEILSMKKMKELIEQLRQDFDTIILDAPPYSPIADARIVTALSDALVLVVRQGKTPYGSIDHALSAVDRNKLLGVVFNDVKPMLFHTYQKFGYYYGEDQQAVLKTSKAQSSRRNYLEP